MLRRRVVIIAIVLAAVLAAPTAAVAASAAPVSTVQVGAEPIEVVVSPDGSEAFVADRAGATVSVIDVSTREVVRTITGVGTPQALAVASDGTLYVTQQDAPLVGVIAPGASSPSRFFTLTQPAGAIALAPDGTTAWVTVDGPNQETTGYAHVQLSDASLLSGSLGETGSATDVAVDAGGTAYFTFFDLAQILGVTDTSVVGSGELPVNQNGLAVAAGAAYVSAGPQQGSGTVSRVDLTDGSVGWTAVVGTLPAAPAVDANGYIYVPIVGADEVTVLSPAGDVVAQIALPAGSQPFSVALTATVGFVTLTGSDQVAVFDLYVPGLEEPEQPAPSTVPSVVPSPPAAPIATSGRELADSGVPPTVWPIFGAAFATLGVGAVLITGSRRSIRR